MERQASNNLLLRDGEAYYIPEVFNEETSMIFFKALFEEIPWQHDEVKVFGKTYITNRKTAWYADGDLSYTYSGVKKQALSWTPTLLKIKEQVEKVCGIKYNACLLNLYHNGEEGMGWHSDNEPELGEFPEIASVSFGAQRRFDFKHQSLPYKISVVLENGSLLWMRGACQRYWKHALPKTKKVKEMRINLTFRNILQSI